MILPHQYILPLDFSDERDNIAIENDLELGVLNLHLCKGIEFTSRYQLPVVKPFEVEIPDSFQAFYRIKQNTENTETVFAHFYTADNKFEKVWKRPYDFIEKFRSFDAMTSTDFSLLTNMLEIHRLWNDFRNKLLAAFYQYWNVNVLPSPSWSDDMKNIERYMEGWPHFSMIAVNSTGVCKDKRARMVWLDGYHAMLDILRPTHILRYGGFIEGERSDISTYFVNNNRVY